MPLEITLEEYEENMDEGVGVCIACGEWQGDYVEPDARGHKCEACGKNRVYGLEELLIMGYVK